VITQNDIARLTDAIVYDTDGDKIGSVGQVYLDAETGDPEWLTLKTGLFGAKEIFVPLRGATVTDDRVAVAYGKDQVNQAPQIDTDGPISHTEEDQLHTFYGLSGGDGPRDGDESESDQSSSDEGGNDQVMTRSEERLVTDTRTEEVGRARLRKYVVTEMQQVTVPVSHEEVRLVREPITDAEADDGTEISEAEHSVILHAERPVVTIETVPVERVRLGTETVRDEETVSGEVRKEQIEFDGPEVGDDR